MLEQLRLANDGRSNLRGTVLDSFVRSSFEQLQIAVSGVRREGHLGVDLGDDSAAVAQDCLDFFEAESLGTEDGGERVVTHLLRRP